MIIYPAWKYTVYSVRAGKWINIAFEIAFLWLFFCTNVVYGSTLQWFIIATMFMKSDYNPRIKVSHWLLKM